MLIIASMFTINSFAQENKKSETFKVWGNCGMCEQKIEKAALKAGATTAEWNSETLMLTVAYNSNTSSNTKIQKAIAEEGYDTQDQKGSDKAYDKLHGCCKYDRKKDVTK